MATETKTPELKKVKMVKIKLNLSKMEKDDVYVAVNGKTFLIKRGVPVEVPEYVAEVLQHKDDQLASAIEYETQAKENAEKDN